MYFIQIQVLVLLIVVFVDFALACRIWISNRKNPINIYFSLAVLMAGLWTFSNLLYRIFSFSLLISLFARLSFFFAALIAVFFFLFTYYFPYLTYKLSKRQFIILCSITCSILFVCIVPDIFIPGHVPAQTRFKPGHNIYWHVVFALYFLGIMGLAFWNMVTKYRKADGIWRLRLRQVIIATIVATIGGSFFNLVLPIVFKCHILNWAGPVFTVFMAGYIWYNVFWDRKKN